MFFKFWDFSKSSPGFWRLFCIRSFFVVFVGLPASLFIVYLAFENLGSAKRFQADATWIDATILDLHSEVDVRDGRDGRNYFVIYAFDAPGQGQFEHRERTGEELFETLVVHETYSVRYLPDNPEWAVFHGGPIADAAQTELYVSGVFLLTALAILAWRYFWLNRDWHVRQEGELVNATVFGIGRLPFFGTDFRWYFADGDTGRSAHRDKFWLNRKGLTNGTTLQVYRLGDRSVWVGDVGKRPEHL